jgi:hypothetical protein
MVRHPSILIVFLAVVPACPSGTPAQKVQPEVPQVGTADPVAKPPSIEACTGGGRHDLMVVDWTPEARGDLEVAMKEGVALLSYDCRSVRLVPSCSLGGNYGYIGTTRREKKIEFASADEVAANLPVGGLSWLSDVGGKLGRERALVAQMVMVGKRTISRRSAARAELEGGCDEVTHFVRAATVGAFVVAAGSKAELAGGAKIVGKGASASSSSSTKIEAHDGELESCTASKPDGKTPPAECGAVVRIELEPIGDADSAMPDVPVASCAPGFAMADGACVRLDRPHQCTPGDAAECKAQCEAGDGGSCATLAVMHREGHGVDKDWPRAAELGKRGCDAGVLLGCRVFAAAKLGGEGVDRDRPGAVELLDQACQGGDGAGCVELGLARLGDKKLAGDAQYAFRRACYGGGEFEGCTWLGMLYMQGAGGMSVNPKLAAPFFDKACKEGSARACEGLGLLYKQGKGVKKDKAKAKQLFEKACNAGHAPACKRK